MSFFATLFFYFKYLVDKYNLIFVYFENYESGGNIRKTVTTYMIFNLLFYLFVTVSFFTIKFDDAFLWGGIVLGVVIVGVYVQQKRNVVAQYNLDNDWKARAGLRGTALEHDAVRKFTEELTYSQRQTAQQQENLLGEETKR